MADCRTCALQYKEACPHQWDQVKSCKRYVEKDFTPKPPRRGGRYRSEPGEYTGEPRKPQRPATGKGKQPTHQSRQKRWPNTPAQSSMSTGNSGRTRPVKVRPYLKTGLRLFYRDKHTGIIQFGTVTKVYHSGFDYAYDGKTVMLGFNVIGTRLFYSWNDAWQHYKKERDGET